MKLTNKGKYAVMAMADLALNAKNGPISLAEISTCLLYTSDAADE